MREALASVACSTDTLKLGRYHAGLKAGQSSQAGWLLELTMRSLAERGGYGETDFCQRMRALLDEVGTDKDNIARKSSRGIEQPRPCSCPSGSMHRPTEPFARP